MEKKRKKNDNNFVWTVTLMLVFLLSYFTIIESQAAAAYTYKTDNQTWTYTIDDNKQAVITAYSGTVENVMIPDTLDGNIVTAIDVGAFAQCASIKTITISNTITSIGSNAFYNCYNLESVTIPSGVTEINNFTFAECKKLKNVTFEADSRLESIGYKAFLNCTFTNITVPKQVKQIDTDAFWGCSQLKFKVADENEYYSSDIKGTLYNKDKTKLILCLYTSTDSTVADGVKVIGKYAFAYNSNLKNITLPKGLEMVENEAFLGCKAIEKIIFPNTVKSVGRNALDTYAYYPIVYYPQTVDLTEADIPTEMTQISYAVNDDKTVSLTVRAVPYTNIKIEIPANIMGMEISSMEYLSGINTSKISLRCTNHFSADGEWGYNEEKHWFATCSVCGLEGGVRETHNLTDKGCRCGYVPFKLTTASKDCTIIYGEECTLSVLAEATLGGEEITYQWYQDKKEISNADSPLYKVTANTPAGEYTYYCKVSCGEYSVNSEEIHIQINKAKNPPNIPEVVMKVPYTISKVGDVSLGDGWNWIEAYKKISLKVGIGVKVTAVYVGEDKGNYEKEKVSVTITRELKEGTVFTDNKSKAQYRVTRFDRNGTEVQYLKSTKETAKTIVIPATITLEGVRCKVTSIGEKAFINNKKVTKVTIGSNVKKIGKEAFYNCKKLKQITIKTTKLTKKNVGSKAFAKTPSNVKIKVPIKKLTAYKTLLKTRGISAKAKIIKEK